MEDGWMADSRRRFGLGLLRVPKWSGLIAMIFVALAVVLALQWIGIPRLTERQIRDAVVTTVERESAEAFLVTGTLDLTATTTVEDTRTVLPGLLDLSLGTSSATVRIPGRVAYGFDIAGLTPDMIRLREDSIVHVTLPELRIFSVEPRLAELEIQTDRGWARAARSEAEAGERALRYVEGALRIQAREHLRTSIQPRVHTANAMRELLTPVLTALGMDEPSFYIELGEGIIVTPSG